MEVPAGKRSRAAARAAEDQDRGAVLRQRRGIRLPAHACRPGPRRRAGRRRAGPQAHAGAGPGTVPAEAVAALADRAGPIRPDTGPGQPRLLRRGAGAKMVGDITYIPTWEGWVYLALVIDCATRMIVGWAMDDNYKTPLITSAVKMAARNVKLPEGAIFHSDRGSNYTSAEYAKELGELGIRQSVGR